MSTDERPKFRAGDRVLHRASGETWVVASTCDGYLHPMGWPDCVASFDDFDLARGASDDEHAAAMRDVVKGRTSTGICVDQRARWAAARFADFVRAQIGEEGPFAVVHNSPIGFEPVHAIRIAPGEVVPPRPPPVFELVDAAIYPDTGGKKVGEAVFSSGASLEFVAWLLGVTPTDLRDVIRNRSRLTLGDHDSADVVVAAIDRRVKRSNWDGFAPDIKLLREVGTVPA